MGPEILVAGADCGRTEDSQPYEAAHRRKGPAEMSDPFVSAVVAVKNGGRFLASAMTSIVNQDYRPLEIVVVDGHSRDNTAAIAQSFEHVRYIKQTSYGIADAYN